MAARLLAARPPRFAQHTEKCEPIPQEEWQPQADLERKLTNKGWKISRVKITNGCYEVYARDEKNDEGRDLLPSEDLRGRDRAASERDGDARASGIRRCACCTGALVPRCVRARLGDDRDGSALAPSRPATRRWRSCCCASSGASSAAATRASRSSCAARAPPWRYAWPVLPRREPRHLGHNPLGAWMVLAPAGLRRRPGADRLALHDRPLLGRRDRRARPRRARVGRLLALVVCTSPASRSRAFATARTWSRRCSAGTKERPRNTTSHEPVTRGSDKTRLSL